MTLFTILQHRRARVLFVCLGNACRSQMAEAFARAYGSDVMEVSSAGIHPAGRLSRRARAVMAERNVPLANDQAPKPLSRLDLASFDLVVNLCEYALPLTSVPVLRHLIVNPLLGDEESHRVARDEIDEFVQLLVTHFRTAKEWDRENPLYSEECAPAPVQEKIEPPAGSSSR
jgi:arsenate reductase (thioredoxin)